MSKRPSFTRLIWGEEIKRWKINISIFWEKDASRENKAIREKKSAIDKEYLGENPGTGWSRQRNQRTTEQGQSVSKYREIEPRSTFIKKFDWRAEGNSA